MNHQIYLCWCYLLYNQEKLYYAREENKSPKVNLLALTNAIKYFFCNVENFEWIVETIKYFGLCKCLEITWHATFEEKVLKKLDWFTLLKLKYENLSIKNRNWIKIFHLKCSHARSMHLSSQTRLSTLFVITSYDHYILHNFHFFDSSHICLLVIFL